ncbi:MAG: hypothetical protein LBE04_05125 [Prevotellaceae bacterium]|jgi:hypothetical protein|nr:hypothetical protein [Prevotellaceae bacterium]
MSSLIFSNMVTLRILFAAGFEPATLLGLVDERDSSHRALSFATIFRALTVSN